MSTESDKIFLKQLLWLFGGFCLICILAGASRMTKAEWNYVRYADILRMRELLSMFLFAPAISVFFWLFYRCLGRGIVSPFMDILCILSIFAVACGMGIHDPFNCLISTYHKSLGSVDGLNKTIVYMDDKLGHWVFWAGFVLGSWCIGLRQLLSPLDEKMDLKWKLIFTVFSIALMWVMLTNLWDEYPKTREDLVVIGIAVSLLIPVHLLRAGDVALMRMPVVFVIYTAYIGSIVGTLACWQLRYGIFF